jgi:hypothetical protein
VPPFSTQLLFRRLAAAFVAAANQFLHAASIVAQLWPVNLDLHGSHVNTRPTSQKAGSAMVLHQTEAQKCWVTAGAEGRTPVNVPHVPQHVLATQMLRTSSPVAKPRTPKTANQHALQAALRLMSAMGAA